MTSGILKKGIEEAEKSEFDPYKVSAVIFKNKRIISTGFNAIRSCSFIHPKYKKCEESLHAEQSAIMCTNWKKLKNSSILILRITPGGKLSMAYPCEMCLSLIKHIKIRNIYYSNYDGEIIKTKLKEN